MTLNSDILWPSAESAKQRVLHFQRKLHQWAKSDEQRRFDDLFNLVHDPATLIVAWERVRTNRGSRSAGVDGATKWHIEHRTTATRFLGDLRAALKARTYVPMPVRQRGIPKAGGKVRYLGIPTLRDRVVQMALKLVLEPIFEVDFYSSSYGYRPARRAQDAIAEIVHFINPPTAYNFAVEGDIKACFDSVHHAVMMAAVRRRIADRKVLALIRAFLGARILKEDGRLEAPVTGTPQGGILSPLLANIYLSALDRPFEQAWKEQTRYPGYPTYLRHKGQATYRIIRYADDFVVMVRGTREQAEQIREMAATILADELRMELSLEKTLITHIDQGFDFLGHHVRRVPWGGTHVGWTFPSKKSLEAVKRKVKSLTDRSTVNLSLKELLFRLNPVLRGWSHYFRYDASKRTLAYVDSFAWWRVFRWLRKKHPKLTWEQIRRRFCDGRWHIQEGGTELFRPSKVKVERYRFRGAKILLPWMDPDELGPVGRFANSEYDDLVFLDELEQTMFTN